MNYRSPIQHFGSRTVERLTRARKIRTLRRSRGLLLDVGGSGLEGWVRIDINPSRHDVYLDAGRAWPFPAGCARAIRAEHMIEHLDWDGATVCVREMFRVLEPGGLCRICTPDLEWMARTVLERDPAVLEGHRQHNYSAPTFAHIPNNYFRMWGHRFVFDFDALAYLLQDSGFIEIERTRFNTSRHDLLHGTDSHDPSPLDGSTLCVDAVKPQHWSPARESGATNAGNSASA
jgi:predicted SAM-dependent methyltransferase